MDRVPNPGTRGTKPTPRRAPPSGAKMYLAGRGSTWIAAQTRCSMGRKNRRPLPSRMCTASALGLTFPLALGSTRRGSGGHRGSVTSPLVYFLEMPNEALDGELGVISKA